MRRINIMALAIMASVVFCSCSKDNDVKPVNESDIDYVGKDAGNFTAAEWYPGGELGTTDNVSAGCYQDETPAVDQQGLFTIFKYGESFFERTFNTSQSPFKGLGPVWVRQSCIACHPAYGHGKRVNTYNANEYGNGYLLVIYDKTTGNYLQEVTGMPQTKASYPFQPPIDESGIHLAWNKATDEHNNKFPDGETYDLIYPEVTIDQKAFNTDPKPSNYEVRLESTIGIYGTGLIDAIPEDDILAQYRKEAKHATLNSKLFDGTNFTSAMYYTLADGTKRIKRFTYALTRASLQDGPGANAIWNITNVTRSDRPKLYTTVAWAKAMSENADVIKAIQADSSSPYYADGSSEGISKAVLALLSPTTNQFDNLFHNFTAEMQDENYYEFMVWHRGLAVPRARNLNDADVQRGKELFTEMGCVNCHRPSWTTGNDNYWAPANIKAQGTLPKYPNQTIWPYTDMIQHKLDMKNDIKGGWCRTTPLWGRGLSLINTGAEDRLYDCRARNEVEAIMWHGYSKNSDAYESAQKFYKLPKSDRDAVVKFLRSI
jgi:CxxC motif-containing protein (DUF1111 family)